MKNTENLAVAVQYNAKKQILINVVINIIIVWLAMSAGVNFAAFVQDIIITNFFVIMFVGGLARMEIRNFRKKNEVEGTWFDVKEHPKVEKYVHMNFFRLSMGMFLEYTIKFALPLLLVVYYFYGMNDEIMNVQTIMVIKLIYVVFLANAVAMKGGYYGTFDERSVVKA